MKNNFYLSIMIAFMLYAPLVHGQDETVQSGFLQNDDLNLIGGGSVNINTFNSFNPQNNVIRFGNGSIANPFAVFKDGRLGIGTDEPSGDLHVATFREDAIRITNRTVGGGLSQIRFNNYNGSVNVFRGYLGVTHNGNIELGGGPIITGHVNILTAEQERLTVLYNGNIGIGTISPAFKLQVNGNTDIIGELTASSDIRLKTDFASIDDAMTKVLALNPVLYNFRTSSFPEMNLPERRKMGFVAQDVEEVLPELVSYGTMAVTADGESFDSKSVNYIEMIPLLTKAIQEQQEVIEEVKRDNLKLRAFIQEELQKLSGEINKLTPNKG